MWQILPRNSSRCTNRFMFCTPSASPTAQRFTPAMCRLANYHRAFILINVGVMQSGGTIDAVVYQATTTAGAGSKVLSPTKAITQLTQAGSDSNSIVGIEVRTEELDVTAGFDCIALQYTVGTAASIMSIEIWGCVPRFPLSR